MTATNGSKGIADIAALVLGEQNYAICVVQMPAADMERYESIGKDDDGPFLVAAEGGSIRLTGIDPETLDEALGCRDFRLHLLDETGLFVGDYEIAAIKPEQAPAYGA